MPWLAEILLFLTPFALYGVWRRLFPERTPPEGRALWLALAGILLGAALAAGYGLSRRMESGTTYVPAQMGADGRIERGHAEPRR